MSLQSSEYGVEFEGNGWPSALMDKLDILDTTDS